jgi:hypothetical protein
MFDLIHPLRVGRREACSDALNLRGKVCVA